MNLNKKLEIWQQEGLLTARQVRQIADFEDKKTKPYLLYSLLGLAVFSIGLGIISIVAANWLSIPPAIKLSVAFGALILCAAAAYKTSHKQIFNALLLLFTLLILATIGLIAQIYQLSAGGLSAFLLWSVLCLPLWFLTSWTLLPLIGWPILWLSTADYLYTYENWRYMAEKIQEIWPSSLALMTLLLWVLVYQVCECFGNEKTQAFRRALKFWLTLTMGVFVYFLDRGYIITSSFAFLRLDTLPFIKIFGIMLALVLFLQFISVMLSRRCGSYLLPTLMSLAMIGSLMPLHFILSLGALFIVGLYAYQKHALRLLNVVVFLAGLRLFILYEDVLGSLTYTGIGFITSGILLLGLVVFGTKISNKFARRIKREK